MLNCNKKNAFRLFMAAYLSLTKRENHTGKRVDRSGNVLSEKMTSFANLLKLLIHEVKCITLMVLTVERCCALKDTMLISAKP